MAKSKQEVPSEGKHLSQQQIEHFKEVLIALRMQVLHKLKGTAESVKSHDGSHAYSQHQADQGTDDFDREMSLEINYKESVMLHKIERALEKIEEQTYGYCDLSGDPIVLARLEAMPYACHTVESQAKLEKESRR